MDNCSHSCSQSPKWRPPSSADMLVTKEILKSSTILNINLLDHLIIGEPENCPNGLGFYSFSMPVLSKFFSEVQESLH